MTVNEQAKILAESISINHNQFITKILNEPTIIKEKNMGDFKVVLPTTTEEWQRDMNMAYNQALEERPKLLAFICKKYNIPLVDMNATVDEFEELRG